MTSQNIPYVIIFVTAGSIAALLALYAWRRRAMPGGIYFVLMMAMVSEWALTSAGEFASLDAATKLSWGKISYLAVASVALLWFLFALSYSRREQWLTRSRLILLWIVPLGILALALTNEKHGLLWSSVTPSSEAPGSMLVYEHGIGVWANLIYSYTLLLVGTILFVRTTLRSPQLYQRQVAVLLVGAAIPWIGNVLYVVGVQPLPGLDLTPIAFTLTGLAMAWGIFRFHMLDIVPVARDVLIESMSDGVVVLDARSRVVDINPAACQVIGRDASQVVGQRAEAVFADWPGLVEHYQDTADRRVEIAFGTTQWFDLRVSPLYDRRKQLTGRLLVLRDITARKQAEAALQQYTGELEARNAELDAFAHTVAHDLKNPLSVLVGYSELLEDRYTRMDAAKVEQDLHTITQAGDKMTRIIDELLLLASVRKVEQVKTQPVDMGHTVEEAQKRVADMIASRQAVINAPGTWPTVVSYAPWVEEVWVNFISNALKYGGSPPQVELGFDAPANRPTDELACPGADGGSQVRFWVHDNGPGLIPEAQAQLFTEFTRLDQTRVEGHGLGLSIVRRIIEKLGGQVGVESQVGQGSTFFFTLPVGGESGA